MPKTGQRQTVDQQIDDVLMGLRFRGFEAAKEIARLRGETEGTMPCPLCQQPLRFATAANGHFRAECPTVHCLSMIE